MRLPDLSTLDLMGRLVELPRIDGSKHVVTVHATWTTPRTFGFANRRPSVEVSYLVWAIARVFEAFP